MPKISFVIPCYFNEDNIPVTTTELIKNETLFESDVEFEYVFVDDGSKDKTYQALLNFKEKYTNKVLIVKLASNVGSYNAFLAGLNFATGDCVVLLAADLQDPPELIPKMFEYWNKGIKLVIANRENREESFLQKLFSNTYHRLIKRFALNNIPPGGFDLVLFDKQLKDYLVQINEKNTNQVYLLSWLGFDYVNIPYVRKHRDIGKSRWTTKKKIKLFVDSFVSFSYSPIKAITFFGLIFSVLSFLYGIIIIIFKLTGIVPVAGWATIMAAILFIASFQMLASAIIGEYLWRALDASRNRPNFIIDEIHQINSDARKTKNP
jgi:glycosyltransferase involved in cell wall biosynthesis